MPPTLGLPRHLITTNGVMWRLLKTGCLTRQSLKRAGHSRSILMGCSRLVAVCDLGLVAAPCVVTNYSAGPRAPALGRGSSCPGSICSNQLCSIYQARPSDSRPSPSDCRPLTISPNVPSSQEAVTSACTYWGTVCQDQLQKAGCGVCVCVCTSTCSHAHVDLRLCASCIVCVHLCLCMHACMCACAQV